MWLDNKIEASLPATLKKWLIAYYKFIRRPTTQQQARTPAELQRLTLLVWGLVCLSLIAFVVSLMLL